MLQFKKTSANQKSFCDFIEKKYKVSKMLKAIDCSDTFFKKIKTKGIDAKKRDDIEFLTSNLRMTICELG
jgi:hypothetical protein